MVLGDSGAGKSALVNGLLGIPVVGVSATQTTRVVTIVRYGDTPKAGLGYASPTISARSYELVDPGTVRSVSLTGVDAGGRAVERAVVEAPRILLRNGLVLVDTPGIEGGTADPKVTSLLRNLSTVTEFVYVSDAGQDYTASQLTLLRDAVRECSIGVCVVTKCDLYQDWRLVVERNVMRLREAGLGLPVIPVSSTLRWLAMGEGEDVHQTESGYPALVKVLVAMADRAQTEGAATLVRETRAVVDDLAVTLEAEVTALRNPELVTGQRAELTRELERARDIQRASARWQDLLSDLVRELRRLTDNGLQARHRALREWVETEVSTLDARAAWLTFEPELRLRTGTALMDHHREVTSAIDAAAERLSRAMDSETGPLALREAHGKRFSGKIGDAEPLSLRSASTPRLDRAMHAARGFSLSGSLVGMSYAALAHAGLAAVFPFTLPVTAVIGVVFARKAVLSLREADAKAVRHEARALALGWLDRVVTDTMRQDDELVDLTFRHLRDHFADVAPVALARAEARLAAVREAENVGTLERDRLVQVSSARLVELRAFGADIDRALAATPVQAALVPTRETT
jgi:hypothetical protein